MNIVAQWDSFNKSVIPDDTEQYARLLRVQFHKLLLKRMQEAGWQTAYPPAVKIVKTLYIYRRFGVHSTKNLEYPDLEIALKELQTMAIAPPPSAEYGLPTVQQHKAITRIGRYVLGAYYKDPEWHYRKMVEWIGEYYAGVIHADTRIDLSSRTVRSSSMLTRLEADHIIKRLEKVELHLKMAHKI